MDNQQETLNIFIIYRGSSETARYTPIKKNWVKIQSNYSRKTISKLNLDYATVFSLAPYMNENVVTIVGICLLIGAMAKSSQIGLHVWLPMAMEGLNRAFLKLHYMREHPVFILWSTVYFVSFGKIQNEGQSAGNQVSNLGSSETTREAITLDDKKFLNDG